MTIEVKSLMAVYNATYNRRPTTTNRCYDCGARFETTNPNQHYCGKCPPQTAARKRESDYFGA